jgi:hypothetical protein
MPETISIPIPVPKGGEHGDIPSHELTLNDLALCRNMLRNNQGRLVIRPGHKQLASTGPTGRVMGLTYYKTAGNADRTVAANRTGWAQFNGSSWVDISGTALTGTTTDEVRFTIFPEGTPIVYNLLGCNNVDSDKLWNGSAATYSALGGSPPVFADITTAANRVLGLVRPNTVRISAFNDSATWSSTLAVILADSGDIMIGMERISRTSVGIYGEMSQWMARTQSGSFPFRFDLIAEYPGPISARSIVRIGGRNYWLALDGNVYYFDGVTVRPVGYAMKRFVIDNLNYTNRAMSHGVFISDFESIFWFFPSNAATAPDFGIYYNIRTGEMGRLLYGNITASSQWTSVALVSWNDLASFTWNNVATTYSTWNAFGGTAKKTQALGDSDGQVHMVGFGDGSDNGTAITAAWEFGLMTPGGWDKNFRPETFESFFRKTTNATTIGTNVGTTDTLASDRTLTAAENIDISVDSRKDIDLATLDLENRFNTVQHTVTTSTGGVEWLGGVYKGNVAGVAAGPVG